MNHQFNLTTSLPLVSLATEALKAQTAFIDVGYCIDAPALMPTGCHVRPQPNLMSVHKSFVLRDGDK
jgi:hypothetical protein